MVLATLARERGRDIARTRHPGFPSEGSTTLGMRVTGTCRSYWAALC